jgi:hypothetical protein
MLKFAANFGMFKAPKDDKKYSWTEHVVSKMMYYGISESRIKRIIRFPKRMEEGIVAGMAAAMQPADSKRYSEIWTMYKPYRGKIKVITAWRYPGKSPERDPVPQEIVAEVRKLL